MIYPDGPIQTIFDPRSVTGASISGPSQLSIQESIAAAHRKEPLNKVLARLAAKARIPMYTIAKSEDIRRGLEAQHYKSVPISAPGVASQVSQYAKEVMEGQKALVKEKLARGLRFSVTTDDYTKAHQAKRYACVNLHLENEHHRIALIRINGSHPAKKGVKLLNKKFKQFGIDLKRDLIAITTDGAQVMVSMGKMLGIIHQLCHAHGLHLAVTDILYKKKAEKQVFNEGENGGGNGGENGEENEEIDESETENEDEDDSEDEEGGLEEELDEEAELADIEISLVKMKKIIRLFRKSPVQNDELQKNSIKELGKELQLSRDCRTRWNTLYFAIKRFLKMQKPVYNALQDLKKAALFLEPEEIETLESVVTTLKHVELGARKICQRDITLASADLIFEFMLKRLKGETSLIGQKMFRSVEFRIVERRDKVLSTLQGYLESPTFLDDVENDKTKVLEYASRYLITNLAHELLLRLNLYEPVIAEPAESEVQEILDSEVVDDPTETNAEPTRSDSDELKDLLASKRRRIETIPKRPTSNAALLVALKKDMKYYESTGNRCTSLELLRQALNSVPVTSVEAERVRHCTG